MFGWLATHRLLKPGNAGERPFAQPISIWISLFTSAVPHALYFLIVPDILHQHFGCVQARLTGGMLLLAALTS